MKMKMRETDETKDAQQNVKWIKFKKKSNT